MDIIGMSERRICDNRKNTVCLDYYRRVDEIKTHSLRSLYTVDVVGREQCKGGGSLRLLILN